MSDTKQTFLEKCYKDKKGAVVIGQRPNAPIILWAISRVTLLVISSESVMYKLVEAFAFGMLFVWAWLELTSGVTYGRRALGGIVLLFVLLNKAKVI